MTREEAIEILKDLWRTKHSTYLEADIRKALDMAIQALSQEPCDLLIIKSDILLHQDDRKKWMEIIKREKESGVIILPPYFEPLLVPNDIGISIEQKAEKWIPVSERLPDFGEKVLCQCRAGIYEVLKYKSYGWYHDDEHCYMSGFVIAWMPLPKPYEPQKGSDKE